MLSSVLFRCARLRSGRKMFRPHVRVSAANSTVQQVIAVLCRAPPDARRVLGLAVQMGRFRGVQSCDRSWGQRRSRQGLAGSARASPVGAPGRKTLATVSPAGASASSSPPGRTTSTRLNLWPSLPMCHSAMNLRHAAATLQRAQRAPQRAACPPSCSRLACRAHGHPRYRPTACRSRAAALARRFSACRFTPWFCALARCWSSIAVFACRNPPWSSAPGALPRTGRRAGSLG